MRYLSLQEVLSLHSLLIAQSGGSSGLRDRGALESAVAQPEVGLFIVAGLWQERIERTVSVWEQI